MCRRAFGLTLREKNPATADGWRASSSVARVVLNGRRLRVVHVGIRATACSPAMLKHAIVLRPRRTRDLMVKIGDHENIFATHLSSKRSARYTSRSRVTGLGVGWHSLTCCETRMRARKLRENVVAKTHVSFALAAFFFSERFLS